MGGRARVSGAFSGCGWRKNRLPCFPRRPQFANNTSFLLCSNWMAEVNSSPRIVIGCHQVQRIERFTGVSCEGGIELAPKSIEIGCPPRGLRCQVYHGMGNLGIQTKLPAPLLQGMPACLYPWSQKWRRPAEWPGKGIVGWSNKCLDRQSRFRRFIPGRISPVPPGRKKAGWEQRSPRCVDTIVCLLSCPLPLSMHHKGPLIVHNC